MTVNKSELFKEAWKIYKESISNGDIIGFSDALITAWAPFKKAVKPSISESKETFWRTYKMVKDSRYSNVPGSRRRSEECFESSCKALSVFSDSELKEAFGKYFDFAIKHIRPVYAA